MIQNLESESNKKQENTNVNSLRFLPPQMGQFLSNLHKTGIYGGASIAISISSVSLFTNIFLKSNRNPEYYLRIWNLKKLESFREP
ncbi:hypothetical protein AMJ86_05060 [bacterium SM23_57]|nr:MAG: hypothetical protein AMJ86_05060 [bacterium SM23_57]